MEAGPQVDLVTLLVMAVSVKGDHAAYCVSSSGYLVVDCVSTMYLCVLSKLISVTTDRWMLL